MCKHVDKKAIILVMKTNFNEYLDYLIECMSEIMDPVMVNGNILDTIKTAELSILSLGLDLVKIRNHRLYEDLGHKNFSAYVQYLVTESQKTRSSIYKWLKIGEVYLKYKDKLLEIGFSPRDSLTKLPYLERALKNKPQKEVYDNLMKMKQKEFSKYARSITENTSKIVEETEDEYCYTFYYEEKEAVKVYKSMGENGINKMLPAVRLAFNMLKRGTFVWAVHLDTVKEWRMFKPMAIKARKEIKRKLQAENLRAL